MAVSRRDFLNGVALTIAAGLTPLDQLNANPVLAEKSLYYPPSLTGLRGSHPGSFESAHRLARAGHYFDYASLTPEEDYDLVIVGAGISGLSAAWLYRKQVGEASRILLLDNHDDFGGHAKRNEFQTDKGMVLGYGGSESLQSPKSIYSENAHAILDDLKVDIDGLAKRFDVNFYPGRGMNRGVFFDQKNFGSNKIVAGDPSRIVADDVPPDHMNARTYQEFVNDFPLPEEDRKQLVLLYEGKTDYLAGMEKADKDIYLKGHSYTEFLRDKVKLSPLAIRYFQQKSNDFQAAGIDALSCDDARLCALPGFDGLGLDPLDAEAQAELDDPYIFHFPDGNASLARMLVRKLIPSVAPGDNMDDVILAKFDYSKLDEEGKNTRLRLNSICVHAENTADNVVEVTYIHKNETLRKIRGKKVIMAGYNMMIPSLVPSLPDVQKQLLRKNVKAPLVYTKVVLNNWRAFAKLGVHYFYCPMAAFSVVKLDYPVSMGGYKHSPDPDHPINLHLIYVPTIAGSGIDANEQYRMGRARILAKPFEEYEQDVREQLQTMLGDSGFNHQEDIIAITVNRWPHGYAGSSFNLSDNEEEAERLVKVARQPFGNIHIANSDAGWSAYAHAAMDEAKRAVDEILGKEQG